MDHAEDDGGGNGDDVFIYMGDDQRVPEDVTHVRVHKSVKTIRFGAFQHCRNLVSIEMHDGVEIIEEDAFWGCESLRGIKLPGVRVIGKMAFRNCTALENVEFGDKLETIGKWAFAKTSIRSVKLPKVRVIGYAAFSTCERLMAAELSEYLERIGYGAFWNCPLLRMVSIPLKANMFGDNVFRGCDSLSQVDLVGGIHKTISSLLLGSWRNEMKDIIGQINRDLPNTPHNEKSFEIQLWMGRVLNKITHYKPEHYALLKNNITQLELALWKANLPNIDAAESRHEARVTCGANIIIPHVLSFLNDADEFPILGYDQAILRDATGEGRGVTEVSRISQID